MGRRRGGEDGADEAGEFGLPPCLRVREARRRTGETGLGEPPVVTHGVNGREPLCEAENWA